MIEPDSEPRETRAHGRAVSRQTPAALVFDADFDLTMGGLRFSVELASGTRLVEGDPNYRPFLGRPGPQRSGEVALAVRLELGPGPATSELPVLFDTGETWAAYASGTDVLLRFPAPGGCLWLTHIPAHLNPVTVYCGPSLLADRDPPGGRIEIRNPLHYPLDQLLTMFVLARHQGILVHAAGVTRQGRAIFLAGPSGAGKTTFMRLCAGRCDLGGLSDDRVIVRRIGEETRIYGTPWAGEGRVAENLGADLTAMVFLHKAGESALRPISPQEALRQLLPTTSVLWFDRPRMLDTLGLCEDLVRRLPAYELHFRPEPQALDLLEELW